MCFYNDEYDWVAEVHELSMIVIDRDRKCCECGIAIAAGSTCEHIYQQENESCPECDGTDPECEHDFGEIFECWTCGDCLKVIKAIEAHEEEEGCPKYARRPSLTQLYQEAFYDHQDAEVYARKCIEMFPELASNQHIQHALRGIAK